MEVNYKNMNRCLVVSLIGELDHHNAKQITAKIDKAIEKNKSRNLVFDFTKMDFMDSSGIGVIMGRYKNIHAQGGLVAVSNVRDSIDRIFTLSGIYKIVKKYDSVEQALEWI